MRVTREEDVHALIAREDLMDGIREIILVAPAHVTHRV